MLDTGSHNSVPAHTAYARIQLLTCYFVECLTSVLSGYCVVYRVFACVIPYRFRFDRRAAENCRPANKLALCAVWE